MARSGKKSGGNKPLRTARDLMEAGLLDEAGLAAAAAVAARFTVRVPPSYLAAMLADGPRPDAGDPLWRTAVPTAAELEEAPEELSDPIGDGAHTPLPGVTHRYPDRALLKPTHSCAIYCRFCFRREKVGRAEENLSRSQLDRALDYIAAHEELWEVILSGGDPLVLADERLAAILERLRAVPHVRVVRFHTRAPVVTPERVTPDLADLLAARRPPERGPRQAVYVVTHINHIREITPAAEAACDRLADRGIPLLNQAVLLAGINDTPEAQEALLRRLVELRVRPYYLHHGDLAPGTAGFRTSIEQGRAVMRALRGRLSGIAQPTYVLDIPGGHGKVPIGPEYLRPAAGGWEVEDPRGRRHPYPPASPSETAAEDDSEGET